MICGHGDLPFSTPPVPFRPPALAFLNSTAVVSDASTGNSAAYSIYRQNIHARRHIHICLVGLNTLPQECKEDGLPVRPSGCGRLQRLF